MRTLIISFLSVALVIGTIIWAEAAMPIDWKPSVLLRVSTGEIPPHPRGTLDERFASISEEIEEVVQIKHHKESLAASVDKMQKAHEALRERIRQKVIQFNQYRP